MEEDELKQKLVHYEELEKQLKQFTNFYQELMNKAIEIQGVLQALEELNRSKLNSKMLVPIASGIFVHSELKNSSEVVVNVGADVCVKKSVSETEILLKDRLADVERHMSEVASVIQQLSELEESLEEELKDYV